MEIVFAGGKKINARYDGFEIHTDQAVASGGEASAAEPFDLFLASIGTCAGVYVLSFCQSRDLPTDGIRILQSWSRDEKRKLVGIQLRIVVPPEFPGKYHRALVRAAEQCSVKRVLQDPPVIQTEVSVVG
jgi:ribosomal protein S12 methylthiotransferase accessory factor